MRGQMFGGVLVSVLGLQACGTTQQMQNPTTRQVEAVNLTSDTNALWCAADAARAAGLHAFCLCQAASDANTNTATTPTQGSSNGSQGWGWTWDGGHGGSWRGHWAEASTADCRSPNSLTRPVSNCETAQQWLDDPNEFSCPCDPNQAGDIAAAVADAATTNDNSAQGIDANTWANTSTANRTLTAGSYFFDGFNHRGNFDLQASGDVQMYVSGDLNLQGDATLTPAADGNLSIFVSGNVSNSGTTQLGASSRPEAFHMYVAGNSISFARNAELDGLLLAPQAELSTMGSLNVDGSVLVGGAKSLQHMDVCYAAALASAGAACAAPPTTGTTAPIGPTMPVTPEQPPAPPSPTNGGCTTCSQCGGLTCFENACVVCSDAAPCCAGRTCVGGTCVPQ